MTITDGMGYVAASLVLAAFCAKRMVSLRALAISSNVAFITYGLAARLWPIVMLHVIMLPLNVVRLRDALAAPRPPNCIGSGATIEETERGASLSLRAASAHSATGNAG
jgi:ABC-type glycerol-3-phosphate transport system permease component